MATTESLTVTVTAADVVVYRSIHAGLSGPAETTTRPGTLGEVDTWLAAHEYKRVGGWGLTQSYEGLWVEATLTRVEQDMTAGLPRELIWNANLG